MSFNLAHAAVIAAALVSAAPAVAEGTKTVKVSYADLNLSSAAGRQELDRRVARTADRICGVALEQHLEMKAVAKRCAVAARESARPTIELAYRNAANRQLAARDMSVTVAP